MFGRIALTAVASVLAFAPVAQAVVIDASEALWLRETAPDTTYAGDGISVWGPNSEDWPGYDWGEAGQRVGIVEFDLSSLAGETIQSISLNLWEMDWSGTQYAPSAQQAGIIPTSTTTATDSLTWNTFVSERYPSAVALEALGAYDLPSGNDRPDFEEGYRTSVASAADIALVQAELDGDGVLTLVLYADEGDGVDWGDGIAYGEYPQLNVTLVPEPASVALLGLGGLLLLRRRK